MNVWGDPKHASIIRKVAETLEMGGAVGPELVKQYIGCGQVVNMEKLCKESYNFELARWIDI